MGAENESPSDDSLDEAFEKEENYVFLGILEALEPDESSDQFRINPELMAPLKSELRELAAGPEVEFVAEGVCKALAALEANGHPTCAESLYKMWLELVQELTEQSISMSDKLQENLTGATDMSKIKPIENTAPPKGAFKATEFIRPLPKSRG